MTNETTTSGSRIETGFAELFATFLRIGLLSFGGPAAQISLMHRTLVDEKGWLVERQFLNALSFCMLLPGPEAMQLATYAGWRLKGVPGGLIAGLLFVLPGAAVIFALATIYSLYGDVPLIDALFLGVKAAVLVIVLEALLRVSKRALKTRAAWIIAGAAFVAIFFLALPFPLIILAAALIGYRLARGKPMGDAEAPREGKETTPRRTAATIAAGLAVWLLPLVLVALVVDAPLLAEIAIFFSKLAVVTFGGAYAVLAYMAQDVVIEHGWLTAGQMMDGLGLAETTPGPLILVTQFVGFLAGFREAGLPLAVAAAGVTLWATFAPCFLWIFAGAPYIERICANPRLNGALGAISAAVVGVILNLSLWFALHVFFTEVARVEKGPLTLWVPAPESLDWRVAALSVLSGVLLLRFHLGIAKTLAVAAAAAWVLVTLT